MSAPDRMVRNGVKEPGEGSLRHAVWRAFNGVMTYCEANGLANVPTVSVAKELAQQNGLSVATVRREYYRWRKFHGIFGRGAQQL